MKYRSTRGAAQEVEAAVAILNGMATDGGLYVPTSIPAVDGAFLASLTDLSYEERAAKIIGLFLTDYTAEELLANTSTAYGGEKFDVVAKAPVRSFSDMSVLELWHGPTSAFKDMALQLLPQLMQTAIIKTRKQEDILILVATSGDTGKAALEGFANVDKIKLIAFYPDGGVSDVQRLQMITQKGKNVAVVAVEGNFDDAQNGVKEIFNDVAFNTVMNEQGIELSSANSINWGRLVPQIVYYFTAYVDLQKEGKIQAGEQVDFTVPTGNFGDILAGFYAKCMGLPVGKLVCAANENNVLSDFLMTGIYDRNRPFHKTISPSMDILISSNLERLLYHMTDADRVDTWMTELAEKGRYEIDSVTLEKIQETFSTGWTDEETTKATIKKVRDTYGYIIDPHTAVAWNVAERERGDNVMVVISTASPYKFNDSVLNALGKMAPKNPMEALDALQSIYDTAIPAGLASLKDATVLHTALIPKDAMRDTVKAFGEKSLS